MGSKTRDLSMRRLKIKSEAHKRARLRVAMGEGR
jgi:hypothetical protein